MAHLMFSLGESFDGVRDELCMNLSCDVVSNGWAGDFKFRSEVIQQLCGSLFRQLFNAVDDLVTL